MWQGNSGGARDSSPTAILHFAFEEHILYAVNGNVTGLSGRAVYISCLKSNRWRWVNHKGLRFEGARPFFV
jgi:hypothetical protein